VGETSSLPNLASRKGIVNFDRSKASASSSFEARNLLEPMPRGISRPSSLTRVARMPEFLTEREFFRTSWWARLGTIFSRYPAHLSLAVGTYFKDLPVRPRKFAGKQLSLSAVLHAAAFLLLPFALKYFPFQITRAANVPAPDQQVLYYHLADPEHHFRAPRIQPPGPGATPGAGNQPQLPPLQGASVSREMLFAISHPKLPDNNHQTIIQPLQAPDLRIKADLKLPNLMLNNPQAPKAHLQFNPNNVKPLQQANREVATVAPALSQTTPQPLTDALTATNNNPRLAVPVGAAPAPNLPSRANGTAADVGAPELAGNGAPGQGLLILGTNPGNSSEMVALPPGNRYGEFSIAPGGSGAGTPGGEPGGSPNGGTGSGTGSGTDAIGPGAGTSGGGGGNNGVPGIISIKGTGDPAGENLGTLSPERVASMVFPLPKFAGPRHNTLLVAAGPMGGGGLSVYGALRCGKIYTVFLPAAGKAWTLQYCQTLAPGQAPPAARITTSVVHMEEPIVPPEADARFDFKRTPLPFEKLHKYVILKGRIDEEGKVADLAVYQGLSVEMDAAARQAFSQWTFRPATRSGKAISVDILVGIPSDPPKATTAPSAAGTQGGSQARP
jgi:hypothetical protein